MAFIPVPNGIKVCMRFTQAQQQVCNVFYVTSSAAITTGLLDDVGTAIKNWWATNVQASTCTNVSLDAIELTDMTAPGGIGIEFTTGLPLLGTNTDLPLPNNVTLATKLSTGLTGRSHRGRQYYVGLPSGDLRGDRQGVTTATQAAIKGFYDALLSDLVAAGVELVVASFFSGGAPRATAVTTPVTDFFVNATLDSQRRRLPERGQ